MLRYFRNLSLLLILATVGCFVASVGVLFCLVYIALSPLLAFHIKKVVNFSMTTESKNESK